MMDSHSPLRFGIVGLGAFGETYLTCLHGLRAIASIEIAAVCSQSADRAQDLARRFEVTRWYTDPEQLARDPDVDVVCVVTTEHMHRRPTIAALEAGKHVIVEKPVATTSAELDEMVAAAWRSPGSLFAGQFLRYVVAYRSLAERVHAGELGTLVSLQSRRNRPAEAVRRYRRTHPILETGILDIDVMIWLTGSKVRQVRGYRRMVNPGPTPDLVWAVLEFESGAIGFLETSWLAPDKGGLVTDDSLNIIGVQGTARIDVSQSPLMIWSDHGYRQGDLLYEPRMGDTVSGALRDQLMHVIRCIREEQEDTYVPLAEVRHGITVAEEIIRSAEEGVERVVPNSV